ncbi:MAG: Ig-like domain-containing protein, partial [Eubacteriales bacterium]|nr:Ig-like domain-containing protein [Eubacteriales bacterium]
MKSIKKLIAAVSAVTIGVTVLAPCAVLAKKESPIAVTETEINFGTNDFESGANGKPWINKISDTAPIELTEYPEHGKVQCVSYTDDSVKTLQSYLTTFNGYYTPNNGAPYEAKYGKYSISCDIMLSQNNVGYKLVLTDRNTGKGIKDDESEASLRFLATIDFLPNGKIGLYKNGVNSWPILDESQYYSIDYKANQWYRMRIDTDTEKSEVALYIDNNFVGSFNWDEYYKKTYKSYSGLSGLVSNIDIQGGKSNGFVPDEITDVSNIKMYFDNLSMDYIVDGSFYGEAELENNAIKVKLSAEPYNLTSDKIKEITVKKSDGGDVSVGNISVSGSEITVPLNDREGGTEYVITLPSDLSDKNGNIIYSPQIYVSSPITSDDIEYLINDDFEREVYNWVKGGTNNKLPDNAVANAPDFQSVTTAYKKADGTVSDSAESDASKVLKMKKTGTAASGLYFNLPSPAVSDFTIEYDYMTDYIAPLGSNLQMTVN